MSLSTSTFRTLTPYRTFVNAYQASLRLQNQLAENRIRFSQRLNEMSDELLSLAREGEKLRKLVSQVVTVIVHVLTFGS